MSATPALSGPLAEAPAAHAFPAFAPGCPARDADAALRRALAAVERAQHGAVLWFAEILRRGLYRDLGYASMPQYARAALGFSESRTGDFMRLARKLDELPALRASVAAGEIGYTKAREIVKVASPRTEQRWVETARSSSRGQLVARVKAVQAKAARRRGRQLELGDASASRAPAAQESSDAALAREAPVRLTLELTPEQHARWEALWERLHKLGAAPAGKAEGVLDGLAALVDAAGTCVGADGCKKGSCESTTPRGAAAAPPVQIHLHQCPECGSTSVAAGGRERPLGRASAERAACDAVVSAPGRRAAATIPPRVRREVLARDRHRCRSPGCGRTRFLEIHHIVPRSRGGGHELANLVTLCSACHQLWHERRHEIRRE